MYRIICALVISLSALGASVNFDDCGSKIGKFTSIVVSNCDDNTSTCILKRGTNATIQIAFNIDKDINKVDAVVHGVLSGMSIPFPIQHPDACADAESGINCPLHKSSGPFTYTASLPVQSQYPRIAVTVKWELKNEQQEDIVCIMIPAKIQ